MMRKSLFVRITVLIFVQAGFMASAQTRTPQAPPTPPPITHTGMSGPLTPLDGPQPGPPILYSIGEPTDEEQLYLEYLNRMRGNPTAEGQRLAATTDPDVLAAYQQFSVVLSEMVYEFSTNPVVPPLAMNAQLLAAARWHSGDMYTNQYQGHDQTNGTVVMNPGDRIASNGYPAATWGENVFSYAESVFYGHAGFAVDWGPGPYGMQSGRGHRVNMFNSGFREVGMGVYDGINGSVGPQLITQDFGTRLSAVPLISGVVYYDLNGNGFYDTGEGIGGVTVTVPGSAYYAITADSGGYAVPVSSNGNYAMTFTAPGLGLSTSAGVVSAKNVKVDYVPAYTPPIVSGPNPAALNQSNTYTFTTVGAATGYQWKRTLLQPYTNVEGAENGLAGVTAVTSGGYSVLAGDLQASGLYSFHLTHLDLTDQSITLNPVIRPTASSQLTFAKWLGYSGSGETIKAQVSTDNGQSWQTVWSQTGNGDTTDVSFVNVNVSLASFAGQDIMLRFIYVFTGGGYYPYADTGYGVYIDNIAVSNASQVSGEVVSNVGSGTTFSFYPTNTGSYSLQVRALIRTRILPWGPATSVTVVVPPPSIQLVSKPTVSGSQVEVDFNVSNYKAGMAFQLFKASNPAGTWAQDGSAVLSTLVPNSKFRFTTTTGGATASFYRVKGIY